MLSLRSLSLSFLFPILGVVSSGGEAIAQEGSKAPLYDLDKVSGCEHFPQDPGLRALLAKNGFAVIPMFHTQIFSPYLCTDLLPPLVTVESAIRTYQVMLEEGLRCLERAQAPRLVLLSRRLVEDLTGLGPKGEPWIEARKILLAWGAVGLRLQAPEEELKTVPAESVLLAIEELKKIDSGGFSSSAILQREDEFQYAQLAPRGFYATEAVLKAFFRAVKWYGVTSFRIRSEGEAACALLLAEAARKDPELLGMLKEFSAPYEEALGRRDDIGLEEAVQALVKLAPPGEGPLSGEKLSAILPAFREALASLPAPRSNDQVLDIGEFREFEKVTQSVRFLGPRYSWAGALFTKIAQSSVEPPWLRPRALHAMMAIGDGRAESLLKKEDIDKAEIERAIEIARAEGPKLWQEASPSIYRDSVAILEELFRPAPPEAPPFCRTDAWKSMCSWAALGSWTCFRHAWQLHEKEVFIVFCAVFKRSGYVVPYPRLFEKLSDLAKRTDEFLSRYKAYAPGNEAPPSEADMGSHPDTKAIHGAFQEFTALAADLAAISRKQIAGQEIDERERKILEDYGETIGYLQFFIEPLDPEDDMPLIVPLAIDATDPSEPTVRYTAIGRAIEIYAIREAPAEEFQHPWERKTIRIPGGPQLYRGGTYSYYEFDMPAGEKLLDDGGWKDLLGGKNPPPFPYWSSEFMLPIRATDAERLAAGEALGFSKNDPDPELKEAALKGFFIARKRGAGAEHLRVFLDRVQAEDSMRLIDLAVKLEDRDPVMAIASAFSRIATPEARNILFSRAATGNPNLLILAMYAVGEKLPPEDLKKVFGSSELGRWILTLVLGRKISNSNSETEGEKKAHPDLNPDLEALKEMANDPSFRVRVGALRALSKGPREFAIPILRKGLEDPSPAVRAMSVFYLPADDAASLPLIARALWYVHDPANRERALEEGKALREWLGYLLYYEEEGLYEEEWMLGSGEEPALLNLLENKIFNDYEEYFDFFRSFAAMKISEGDFEGRWNVCLREADPSSWRKVALGIALDPLRSPKVRQTILEFIRFSDPDPETAFILKPLLDDRTIIDEDGVRIADLAAQAILCALRLVEKDWPEDPPSDNKDREAAIERAKAAINALPKKCLSD